MAHITVPLDLNTGLFPATLPFQLQGVGLEEEDWVIAVSGLNAVLSKNDGCNGPIIANCAACCLMILDLPLLVILIWSQAGKWYDHWYENPFFLAVVASSLLMLPMMCYLRKMARQNEERMCRSLMQANEHLLPKMVQVVLMDDPQSVLALQVVCGATEPVLFPVVLDHRLVARSWQSVGNIGWAQGAYGRGVVSGQPIMQRGIQTPNSGGNSAMVIGNPVNLPPGATMGMPPGGAPPQPHLLTIQIPDECQPGQTFQFVHPATNQVMQAQRPLDGASVVQIQV